MTRIAWTEAMSDYEYVDLLAEKAKDLMRRSEEGEDTEIIRREKQELDEDFEEFKAMRAARMEAASLISKPAAATVVPTVEATVEKEPEEDEEWEDEDYSDDESEEEDDDYATFQQFFTRIEYDIIFNEKLDITEAQRSAFIYSLRDKNEVVKGFLKQWEQQHGVIQVIDPYNQVPKTEVVRDGDIISVRFVDGPPADKQIQLIEEPEVVVDDVSKEITLDATFEPAIATIPEVSSPIINGDVAHHPEPVIELSLDNARDELSIESKEDGDKELSNANLEEKASVSIDGSAIVDRHREESQADVDFNTQMVQNSLAQSVTPVDFVFSPETFQTNPDPYMANEEPIEMRNPLDFLFGIIRFLKNGAKRLASKIDRRRTKGALALPFDSCD